MNDYLARKRFAMILPAEPASAWATLQQAAEHYQVSERTIRRMIARGDIEARRIGGRLIRVNLNSTPASARPLPQYRGDAA